MRKTCQSHDAGFIKKISKRLKRNRFRLYRYYIDEIIPTTIIDDVSLYLKKIIKTVTAL